jgi:hypothetical protein
MNTSAAIRAGVMQRFNVGAASRRRESILEGLCLP